MRFFGMIQKRIIDEATWIMVYQKNRRVPWQSGFIGSFDAWTNDPFSDNPKETHPKSTFLQMLATQHLEANINVTLIDLTVEALSLAIMLPPEFLSYLLPVDKCFFFLLWPPRHCF